MEQEIINGNTLICKYMGFNYQNESDTFLHIKFDNMYYGITERKYLRFDTDWNWLMPCVGKISNECEEPDELDVLKHALLTNNKKEAWKFVVDYIVKNVVLV